MSAFQCGRVLWNVAVLGGFWLVQQYGVKFSSVTDWGNWVVCHYASLFFWSLSFWVFLSRQDSVQAWGPRVVMLPIFYHGPGSINCGSSSLEGNVISGKRYLSAALVIAFQRRGTHREARKGICQTQSKVRRTHKQNKTKERKRNGWTGEVLDQCWRRLTSMRLTLDRWSCQLLGLEPRTIWKGAFSILSPSR